MFANVLLFDQCPTGKNERCGTLKLASERTVGDPNSVRLVYLPVLSSPAKLDEVISMGPDDLIHKATLYNVGREPIKTVRIGWVVTSPDPTKTPVAGISEPISLSVSSKPNSSTVITPKRITLQKVATGSSVSFFVAETLFASGKQWRANIEQMKWDLMPASSRLPEGKTDILPRDVLNLQ